MILVRCVARNRRSLLASAAVFAVQLGCSRVNPETLSAQHPGAPVIVISIDTLRADRLPIYGYRKGSTPAMDRLAREGIVFDDVYSHAPLTLPSHASLFTGLLPTRHGVRDNIGYTLTSKSGTLASRFKAAGYATPFGNTCGPGNSESVICGKTTGASCTCWTWADSASMNNAKGRARQNLANDTCFCPNSGDQPWN